MNIISSHFAYKWRWNFVFKFFIIVKCINFFWINFNIRNKFIIKINISPFIWINSTDFIKYSRIFHSFIIIYEILSCIKRNFPFIFYLYKAIYRKLDFYFFINEIFFSSNNISNYIHCFIVYNICYISVSDIDLISFPYSFVQRLKPCSKCSFHCNKFWIWNSRYGFKSFKWLNKKYIFSSQVIKEKWKVFVFINFSVVCNFQAIFHKFNKVKDYVWNFLSYLHRCLVRPKFF